MTKAQQEYAIKRVAELEKVKLAKLNEELMVPKKELSEKVMLALVHRSSSLPASEEAHRIPLSALNRAMRYLFDFSGYETDAKPLEGYEDRKREICDFANRAKDQIMLGSSSEALQLIEEMKDL